MTMMPKLVIGVTGMPGAGKGEFCRIATEKYNLAVVRMGDLVWAETQNRGLQLTAENVGKVADDARKTYGAGIWAERTAGVIQTRNLERVVIDGIRSDAEVKVFRHVFRHAFVLVAIHASPAVRRGRIFTRARENDTDSCYQFEARDERELRWGIGNAIALADYLIVNESTITDFHKAVIELIRKLINTK